MLTREHEHIERTQPCLLITALLWFWFGYYMYGNLSLLVYIDWYTLLLYQIAASWGYRWLQNELILQWAGSVVSSLYWDSNTWLKRAWDMKCIIWWAYKYLIGYTKTTRNLITALLWFWLATICTRTSLYCGSDLYILLLCLQGMAGSLNELTSGHCHLRPSIQIEIFDWKWVEHIIWWVHTVLDMIKQFQLAHNLTTS